MVSFPSPNDCTSEYELACGFNPSVAQMDFSACQAALATAACGHDPSSSAQGLVLPATCAALF
jgi:hypothetical protein